VEVSNYVVSAHGVVVFYVFENYYYLQYFQTQTNVKTEKLQAHVSLFMERIQFVTVYFLVVFQYSLSYETV